MMERRTMRLLVAAAVAAAGPPATPTVVARVVRGETARGGARRRLGLLALLCFV